MASLSFGTHEYLSPVYSSTTHCALRSFIEEQSNAEARFKARIMLERWWLYLAMHFHCGMREMAGPYSRCYNQPSICSGNLAFRLKQAYGWQTFYEEAANDQRKVAREIECLPSYIDNLLAKKELPCFFREIYRVIPSTQLRKRPLDSVLMSSNMSS